MLQRIIITVIVCLSGFSLSAQNTEKNEEEDKRNLTREMTLEREYDPIVQDAAKVNTLPLVKEMTVQKRPIVYSDYTISLFPEKQLNVLPDGTTPMDVLHSVRNGYLHASGGMFMNFVGDFGYHLLNNSNSKLGIWFSHRSANGNVRFLNNDTLKRKAVINDNIGGIDFNHRFNKSVLKLGGKFGYSAFNYYGVPTNRAAVRYVVTSSYDDANSVYEQDYDTDTNQGNRLINAYAALASTDKTALGYHFGVDFSNFNQKYSMNADSKGMTENHFKIDFGLSSAVNDGKSFGADITANVLTYTAPDVISYSIPDSAFKTHFNGTINPYFLLEKDTWRLLLGVNLMLVSQNSETDFLASPNISFTAKIADLSVFYTDLKGGIESNSMAELSRLNRYINTFFTADASKTWADLTLGFRGSPAAGFWFDVFGGFKYTEGEVFFNPSSYAFTDKCFPNMSMTYQPVSQRVQGGLELKYDYRQVVDFYLKGVYYHYTVKDIDTWKNAASVRLSNYYESENESTKPLGKPSLVINAGVNVRPVKPLTISLDYTMLSGMYAGYYDDTFDYKIDKMPAVNDLRLRSSWQFTDQFSLYAQLNNLLFRRHEIFYGYPLQPFSVMGGFNVNF